MNTSGILTQGRLRSLFSYDGSNLYWKSKPTPKANNIKIGSIAGCLTTTGYRAVTVDGKRHQAHRLVWFMVKGSWPENQLDHINGDKLDNRIENLREVTNAENCVSFKSVDPSAKSKFRGVSPCGKRWRADICKDGVRYNLGRHDTEVQAAKAYNQKAIELGFNREALNET